MAKTIVALFPDLTTARNAVVDLDEHGIGRDRISVVSSDAGKKYAQFVGKDHDHREGKERAKEAAKGAGAGAVVGGLTGILATAAALAIPGIGPIVAAGPLATVLAGAGVGAGVGAAVGGLVGALTDVGVPRSEAEIYAEGVRRGGALVVVNAPNERVSTVSNMLERHNPIDIERTSRRWREEGWTGYNTKANPLTEKEIEVERKHYHTRDTTGSPGTRPTTMGTTGRTGTTGTTGTRPTTMGTTGKTGGTGTEKFGRKTIEGEGEETIDVVEEDVMVGKREVDRGGVRVRSYVVNEPVDKDVRVRDETIRVERTPVDKPLRPGTEAFKEGTIEMHERDEEVVVGKQARVKEQVKVKKDVGEHVEHVHEDRRRTRVEVEKLGTEEGFTRLEPQFQTHYTAHLKGGDLKTYEEARPAYRLGYTLASDKRFRDHSWSELEPQARTHWEREGSRSKWERVKDAVRHGWNEARNTGRH